MAFLGQSQESCDEEEFENSQKKVAKLNEGISNASQMNSFNG